MQYLLDRSHPFDHQKARLLDELTYAIKNNTAEVPSAKVRANRPTRRGGS